MYSTEATLATWLTRAYTRIQDLEEQLADAQAELQIVRDEAAFMEARLAERVADLEQECGELETEVSDLRDQNETFEADGEMRTDARDQLVTLLNDYRVFKWIDRLDEALRLAEGAA